MEQVGLKERKGGKGREQVGLKERVSKRVIFGAIVPGIGDSIKEYGKGEGDSIKEQNHHASRVLKFSLK